MEYGVIAIAKLSDAGYEATLPVDQNLLREAARWIISHSMF